jgi:golgi SNAP receptor complex member 2
MTGWFVVDCWWCNRWSRLDAFQTISTSVVMTSIVELFPKCRKLAYDARQQLGQVQVGSGGASELFILLEELARQLEVMDGLVNLETPEQRETWNRKIGELRMEAQALQQQGQTAEYSARSRYLKDRDELQLRRRKIKNPGDESDVQNLADEGRSLEQSSFLVGGLLSQGEASLGSLVEQRQRLRGVRSVVSSIGDTLGLTNATMKIIERRDITDAYLVAAGMLVTLLVIYFVWF